jgi:hypothetical protein
LRRQHNEMFKEHVMAKKSRSGEITGKYYIEQGRNLVRSVHDRLRRQSTLPEPVKVAMLP